MNESGSGWSERSGGCTFMGNKEIHYYYLVANYPLSKWVITPVIDMGYITRVNPLITGVN